MKFRNIPVEYIHKGRNVRSEPDDQLGGLMESVEQFDCIQPILVRPDPENDGHYIVVAGHRRLAAMQARNESTVPAIIRTDITDGEIPFLQLTENIQRKQMSPHEIIAAVEALQEAHPEYSRRHIAKMLGKTGAWLDNKYKAAQVIQELVSAGVPDEEVENLPETTLLQIGKIGNIKERKEYTKRRNTAKKNGGRVPKASEAESYRTTNRPVRESFGGFTILEKGPKTIVLVFETTAMKSDVVKELYRLKMDRIGR